MKPRSILPLVGLSVLVVVSCTPFHGSDVGEDSGATSNGSADDGGLFPGDGGLFPGDGGLFPGDGGPAASCFVSGGPGNVTFTTTPPTPHVGAGFVVNAIVVVPSGGSISNATLRFCTPSGTLTKLTLSNQTNNAGNKSTQFVYEYAVKSGVPTAGVTELVFASPGDTFFGTAGITIIP